MYGVLLEKDAILRIREPAIGKLSRMICGDPPYGELFPYRSGTAITSFFEEIDLDYVHDGSTRYSWVRDVLSQLNRQPSAGDDLPSTEMAQVIKHLVDPAHFAGWRNLNQAKAVDAVNELLRRDRLLIQRDEDTGDVQLRTIAGGYVSTAVPRSKAKRVITFAPKVFSVPEGEPDSQSVAVMMPFAAEFTPVCNAIRAACEDVPLSCCRADDIWEDSTFIQDVFNLIFKSSIVIVDFTGRNPNVMYETGISHTLGKHVVPVTQNIEHVPSDLRHHRVLKYLPNKEGLNDLTLRLTERLRTLREEQKS